jgi:glycine cleavage system aminomethyltransferase T
MGLRPGHTSSIRRIEGGMLSYHADMDAQTNPFELGLDRLVDLEMPADFIGKAALKRVQQQEIARQQIGLEIDGKPLSGPNTQFWPVEVNGEVIGKVTSAVYSPRLQKNIALAMVASAHSAVGITCDVQLPDETRAGAIVPKPFYDPKKQITAGATTTAA